MITKEALSKIHPTVANRIIQSWVFFTGSRGIVHHGLQRSGTNYLNDCLWICGTPPLNSFDDKRNSPRHKHCRWYANKKAIPEFIAEKYNGTLFVDHIEAINTICGYPSNTAHLVVKKNENDWLASIMNWGIKCNWFKNKCHAVENLDFLIADYENYYKFWKTFSLRFPQRVSVIDLGSIYKDFQFLINSLSRLGLKIKRSDFRGQIEAVSMSPLNRAKIVTTDDIKKARKNCESSSN